MNNLSLNDLVSTQVMNAGEELGAFKAYDPQLEIKEIAGTRIVKCLYRTQEGKKPIAENVYTRISNKHLTEEVVTARISELAPYVLSWLEELEDKEIKENHKAGLQRVYNEGLSLDKIIQSLENAGAGSRLNKADIEKWFIASIFDKLEEKFALKITNGMLDSITEEDLDKVAMITDAYKAKFASLANPKVSIKEADCEAMIKVITECCEESDFTGKKFIARLEKMGKKVDISLEAL